jgi:N-acetylglucosamine-6-phosphate deacetylase
VRLGVDAALVDGAVIGGDVRIEDGEIAEVGVGGGTGTGLAVPGYVDLHLNGIAGVDFLGADDVGYLRAREALAATGVVAFQPTMISSPPRAYREPMAAAEAARQAGGEALPEVIGVHLEGPFLAERWAGAHDPANLRPPDARLAGELLGLGPVTTMTLAPELPGALELIERLVDAGIVVSCGHSDADAATANAAFDRGARAVTHVYNAHRRWQPRDPGLAGVALTRADVYAQAIVDLVHLAGEAAYAAFLAAGPRFCLVTDSVAAVPAESGPTVGGRPVHLRDGAAFLPDGTLIGSLLTLDQAVRNLVSLGAEPATAVWAASTTPARLLGRDDLGVLRPGVPANVVVLDEDLRVRRTIVAGAEAFAG